MGVSPQRTRSLTIFDHDPQAAKDYKSDYLFKDLELEHEQSLG